ncbi:glucosidase family protein [Paenibacillus silvisoli]|uniref:hypothetical protein n=1 Tax=Paenibacillus silvisoli TaxID=3110539 RepID=UPI0028043E32|nr:hypothetical protein [Paenibacillus silvisoli]
MSDKPIYNVYSMVEHLKMAEMKKKHPDWLWNRSDTHALLGVPTSHEGYKTAVEPGNSFSPGHRTYGVSTWLYADADGKLHTPEELPIEQLSWSFLEGHIPVLRSSWKAGGFTVESRLFTDGNPDTNDIKTYFSVELGNEGSSALSGTLYVAIRSFGAAGGPISSLAMAGNNLKLNGETVMVAGEQPSRFGAVSYAETGRDIYEYVAGGELPSDTEVVDASTWASGALAYELKLEAGEKRTLSFVCQVHGDNWMVKRMVDLPKACPDVGLLADEFAARWQAESRIKLRLPDRRFQEAMLAQLTHLYMFTVDAEPRITPVSYPLWWLRDGAYVLVALDKGGYSDFTERALRAAAPRDAFGGFGAEGDGPANGIWMMSEHYLLTRSKSYLQDMYPHIVRKAELLREMRHTTVPVKRHNEFRTPEMLLRAESDLLCMASRDGLIMGRMDHHQPILWINGYAYLALKRAAMCAEALGIEGTWFAEEAEELKKAIRRKGEELFGDNPRDPNSVFWPTGWGEQDDSLIIEGMERFWNEERFPNGSHQPEPHWTYFEAGQAHNYLLMGRRDRAWVSIEHFLTKHTAPGLYTYHEGCDDENSSLQWQRSRGWDEIRYITPHGWTAAELFLLLRDCLAREDEDTLVIGSGVPEAWMSEPFAVSDMPTYFGALSFSYTPEERKLRVTAERLPDGGIRSELPGSVELELVVVEAGDKR